MFWFPSDRFESFSNSLYFRHICFTLVETIMFNVPHGTPQRLLSREREPFFMCTADPTWGDIFEYCFTAKSSKLERLFSLKRGKRDIRALSFKLSKMSLQVGLALHACLNVRMYFVCYLVTETAPGGSTHHRHTRWHARHTAHSKAIGLPTAHSKAIGLPTIRLTVGWEGRERSAAWPCHQHTHTHTHAYK